MKNGNGKPIFIAGYVILPGLLFMAGLHIYSNTIDWQRWGYDTSGGILHRYGPLSLPVLLAYMAGWLWCPVAVLVMLTSKKSRNRLSTVIVTINLVLIGISQIPSSALQQITSSKLGPSKNRSGMFYLSEHGTSAQLRKAIDSGGDVNWTNEMGLTPLKNAIQSGKIENVKILIEKGASIKQPDIWMSVFMSDSWREIADLLITAGADVNQVDKQGRTALLFESYTNEIDRVRYLVEHGANVNAKGLDGETSLKNANRHNHREMINLLKNAGAKE